jgi:hypothetical protein
MCGQSVNNIEYKIEIKKKILERKNIFSFSSKFGVE